LCWILFNEVINNFFKNIKRENYETIVNSMLENYPVADPGGSTDARAPPVKWDLKKMTGKIFVFL
jgi:hypothetical protein